MTSGCCEGETAVVSPEIESIAFVYRYRLNITDFRVKRYILEAESIGRDICCYLMLTCNRSLSNDAQQNGNRLNERSK